MKICAVVACAMVLLALTLQVPRTYAQTNTETEILIDPSFTVVRVGDNVTITVNVTNVPNLCAWQVVLKYNGTVINATAVWVPEDNVFAGKDTMPVEPQFGNDTVDGSGWIMYGNTLIWEPVAVSNGILFKANLTVVNPGETTIIIATEDKPAHPNSYTTWASYLLVPDSFVPISIPFTGRSSTVVSEGLNVTPIAIFSVVTPKVDNTSQLVLLGHAPAGNVPFAQSYAGFTVGFNASASYDPDGNITSYVWDFGDGNVTATSDSFITHAYNVTGRYTVTLVVVDNGEPPAQSNPTTFTVVAGLVLQVFDWAPFEYTVLAIIAIAIVAYVAMKTGRYLRRRSELKKQKMLAAKRLTASSTVVKTK